MPRALTNVSVLRSVLQNNLQSASQVFSFTIGWVNHKFYKTKLNAAWTSEMAVSVNNRKRSRSPDECDYTVQTKQFINEQIIIKNSQTKMKEIHGKFSTFTNE